MSPCMASSGVTDPVFLSLGAFKFCLFKYSACFWVCFLFKFSSCVYCRVFSLILSFWLYCSLVILSVFVPSSPVSFLELSSFVSSCRYLVFTSCFILIVICPFCLAMWAPFRLAHVGLIAVVLLGLHMGLKGACIGSLCNMLGFLSYIINHV